MGNNVFFLFIGVILLLMSGAKTLRGGGIAVRGEAYVPSVGARVVFFGFGMAVIVWALWSMFQG